MTMRRFLVQLACLAALVALNLFAVWKWRQAEQARDYWRDRAVTCWSDVEA